MYKSIQSCINEIFLMEDEVKRREFIKKQHGDKLSDSDVNAAIEHDPSKNKAYAPWIARGIAKGHITHEDLPVVNKALEQFHTSKHTLDPADRDLNRYKSHRELHAKLNPNAGKSSVEITPEDQKYFNKKEASLIHHDENSRVVVPLSDAAAKHFGKGTSWCTTAGAFNTYHKVDDPLYVVNHKDGFKHQIHFGTSQHMDPDDKQYDNDEFNSSPAAQTIKKHYRSLDHLDTDNIPEVRQRKVDLLFNNTSDVPHALQQNPEARSKFYKQPNSAAKYFADDPYEIPTKSMHDNIMKHADKHLIDYMYHMKYTDHDYTDPQGFNKLPGIHKRIMNSFNHDTTIAEQRPEVIRKLHHVLDQFGSYPSKHFSELANEHGLGSHIINDYDKSLKNGFKEKVHNNFAEDNFHRYIEKTDKPSRTLENAIGRHNNPDHIIKYLNTSGKLIWPEKEEALIKHGKSEHMADYTSNLIKHYKKEGLPIEGERREKIKKFTNLLIDKEENKNN